MWSIEVSAIKAQISFELEMDCKIEEFLEISYSTDADLSGTQIEEQIKNPLEAIREDFFEKERILNFTSHIGKRNHRPQW